MTSKVNLLEFTMVIRDGDVVIRDVIDGDVVIHDGDVVMVMW